MKKRAETATVVAANVRNDAAPLRAWFNEIHKPDFDDRIARAINDPTTADAKRLINVLAPLVSITAAKVPFSPFERGVRAA